MAIPYNRFMTVDTDVLKSWRLQSQRLKTHSLSTPAAVVQWLGGVQAQAYAWAKWSIGVRLGECSDADVEAAIENGLVVRTWLFRGTLHFVAASDLAWLTALLAPRIVKTNRRRYKQLALDAAAFRHSQDILQQAIAAEGPLTRSEIKAHFESVDVPAEGQQLPYLLQRAALDGLICLGLQRDGEPTYVLVSEWVERSHDDAVDEGLSLLASRYFAGHGPATIDDFAWWTGFTKTKSRAAVEAAADLTSFQDGSVTYWAHKDEDAPPGVTETAHLLPPFDDYLLGYRERTVMLDPQHEKKVNPGGGMLKPTAVINGEVVGIWQRQIKKREIVVTLRPFRHLDSNERDLLADAAARFAGFNALPLTRHFEPVE